MAIDIPMKSEAETHHGSVPPPDGFELAEPADADGHTWEAPPDREGRILAALERLRISDEARRRFGAEQQAIRPPAPDAVRLDDLLGEHDETPTYRIDRLLPSNGRAVLNAPRKSGKTTLRNNLARSLADGTPFLGAFEVRPADKIAIIDIEMHRGQLRAWLQRQRIAHPERITVYPLRGHASTFNLLDADVLAEWAKRLDGTTVVLFDCLRPVLDALGLDENHDAGRFLVAYDELLATAGIAESVLVHHSGHNGERSRGDSRIEDWPDALWRLVREKADDDHAPRYFRALGRDVEEPEQRLDFDPITDTLTIGGGSRVDAKTGTITEQVHEHILDNPGQSQNEIEKAIGGRRENVRDAIARLTEAGRIIRHRVGSAFRHWPADDQSRIDVSPTSPDLAPGERANPPPDLAPSPYRASGEGEGRGAPSPAPRPGRSADPKPPRCPDGYAEVQHPDLCGCGHFKEQAS